MLRGVSPFVFAHLGEPTRKSEEPRRERSQHLSKTSDFYDYGGKFGGNFDRKKKRIHHDSEKTSLPEHVSG